MDERRLKKKLNIMILTVALLVCGLTVTSFALADAVAEIRSNRFAMSAGINLKINGSNGDVQSVVDMNDILFEPGGTYRSEFSISNPSDLDLWYRVSLTNVEGNLKDDITVTIKESDGYVLAKGKMDDLKVFVSALESKKEKTIYIEFYFSPNADNSAQGQTVSFNVKVDATQSKNNQSQVFGD